MPTTIVLRDGFGDEPAFVTLLAEMDDQPVGLAMYHHAYETEVGESGFYLSELYVRPAYRRRGIARALIAAISREVLHRGRAFVWWASEPDNEAALALYRKLASREDSVVAFALFGERLAAIANEPSDATEPQG